MSVPESIRLRSARQHLVAAERQHESPEGLLQLEEGLALLDELCVDETPERTVAQNVAAAYSAKIFARVQAALSNERTIPQPRLEHYFKLMLAFDTGDFDLPDEARDAKIAVARRLIDLLYEGYPPAVKQAAIARLGEITRE
jgi:hypothetical protein